MLILLTAALCLGIACFKLYRSDQQKVAAIAKANIMQLKYDKVYNAGIIGLWTAYFDGRIIEANDAFLEMIGYERADLLNGLINWRKLTPPEFDDTTYQALEQLRETGICKTFEKEYIKKDGSRVAVMLGSSQMDPGKDSEIVAYALNISGVKESALTERRLNEEIRKKQQETLSILMDAPVSIVIVRGEDLKLDFINNTARAQMGRMQEDLTGCTTEEHFRQTNTSFSEETVKDVYRTGRSFKTSSFHVEYDPEGKGRALDHWFDIILEPVYNADGEIDGVASYTFDVTELVETNMALKLTDTRFRFIADAIPHKLWTCAPDGTVNYFNKGWYDYTGARSFDELKETAWGMVHPDDIENAELLWKRAVERGQDIEIEQRFRRHDGIYFWHLTRVCVCREDTGEIKLLVGTSTNIHSQKLAQQSLKESESHFKALADNNALLIWKTDENNKITFVNNTWRLYTGVVDEAIKIDHWLQNIHPDDREMALTEFEEAFSQRSSLDSKYRFMNKQTGHYHWVLSKAQPLLEPDFKGYVGSLTDIHEQELAQIAARILMEKKDEFFGIASHELKTPITSMKASLQMLERLCYNEAIEKKALPFVSMANKQVNKLTAIVNDLLDITKIQAGKLQLDKSNYDLVLSVMGCIDEIHSFEPNAKIKFNGGHAINITADRIRVEQVIINLLSNAVKYSKNSDEINVVISNEENSIKVSIIDKGIGISPEKHPFIFDRFFRVHSSSQHYSGLGLGLYISSQIINQHKGKIGVISEVDKGSAFWFTLPL